MPTPRSHLRTSADRRSRPSAFAAWRPFLTGVVLGLAFLVALGAAMARGTHTPMDTPPAAATSLDSSPVHAP